MRLHDRGFKKYALTKLFQHVKFLQRNKLLKTELPLPNVCQPLTIQEAERRIFQEGEASFALSQQDEEISVPLASPLNATLTNNNSKTALKKHKRNKPLSRDFFN